MMRATAWEERALRRSFPQEHAVFHRNWRLIHSRCVNHTRLLLVEHAKCGGRGRKKPSIGGLGHGDQWLWKACEKERSESKAREGIHKPVILGTLAFRARELVVTGLSSGDEFYAARLSAYH